MNKILLQCDNLCKRYQEGNVQTDVYAMSASALVKAR